jgi:hypothetical protein
MGTRQKILILILVGVFGFLVFQGWHFAKKHWLAALADFVPEKAEPLKIVDTDGDGLSDTEESFYDTNLNDPDTDGDGYLDGEEVASGYNPRIPYPDDVKPGAMSNRSASINLTDRMGGRILASFYEGGLNPNDSVLFDQTLDNIAINTLLESVPIFQPPSVDESEILIDYSPQKEAQQEYLNALLENVEAWIIPTMVEHTFELQEVLIRLGNEDSKDYDELIHKYAARNKNAIQNLRSLNVPKSWADIHLSILDILNQYEATYDALILSYNDQIKALLGFQKITALHQQAQNIAPQILIRAREQGLGIPNSSFSYIINSVLGIGL